MDDKNIILSFDIGIRNLSFSAIIATKSSDTLQLLLWKNISLLASNEKKKNINLNEISGRLFTELDDITNNLGYDINTVLIENQPSNLNGQMKSIQMMVYSYYQLRRHWEGLTRDVLLIPATQKLLNHSYNLSDDFLNSIKNKKPYDIRKLKSIEYIKKYIENDPQSLDIFNSYKKKDDCSDNLNQAISWLNKQNYNIKHIQFISSNLNIE